MPKLINKSARLVTIPVMDTITNSEGKQVRIVSERISFPPLQLVLVSTETWKKIKKIHMIKKMLDEGDLLEGAAASRESVSDEDVMTELSKDLTEEERLSLAG